MSRLHLIRRYLINLEDRAAIRDAAIPVERIRCPLLLVSGDDDAMWPSTLDVGDGRRAIGRA